MEPIEIFVAFIVAIFGLAYPILLQVISGLDEKYSSRQIVNLFQSERVQKIFYWSMMSSLASIIIYACGFHSPDLGIKGWTKNAIDNSALLLVAVCTIITVISFIILTEKMFLYNIVPRLVSYLIDKHKTDRTNEFVFFRCISDLLIHSVKKENQESIDTTLGFISESFYKERNKNTEGPIEYPQVFYDVTHKTLEELLNTKRRPSRLNHVTAGGTWLLGSLNSGSISDKTYYWLWENLKLIITYKEDDFLMLHWGTAHQYMDYSLANINPEYSRTNGAFEILNEPKIIQRKQEKRKFLEFHIALGGLLLYDGSVECIKRAIRFSQSIPPRYTLIPVSSNEIFEWYLYFRDPLDMNFNWIEHVYPFPRLEGVSSGTIIKNWICRYLGILFIRLYSVRSYYGGDPLNFVIPKTIEEMRHWFNNIDSVRNLIVGVFEDDELKEKLGFGFINDNWLVKINKLPPAKIFEDLRSSLENSIVQKEIDQEISEQKEDAFKETSEKLILERLEECKLLQNQEVIFENYSSWFINGLKTVTLKSEWSEEKHFNASFYNPYLAHRLIEKISEGVSETFFYSRTSNYILKDSDLFLAIDKLLKDDSYSKDANLIIVSFGIHIEHFIETLKVKDLTINSYKNIPIFTISHFNADLLGSSLFLMQKNDLPYYVLKEIQKENLERTQLQRLSEDQAIYYSILDLNRERELQSEFTDISGTDLAKSALVTLAIDMEVRWKKTSRSVHLIIYSEYREQGFLNSLGDITIV